MDSQNRRDAPFEIHPWSMPGQTPNHGGPFGELEQETILGPLTATLRWLSGPFKYDEVVRQFGHVGGVYIAFREGAANGKPLILKVGMTGTFARRMKDAQYVAWSRQYPTDLRFHLAEVRGHRGNRGIGGVVQMVELALARLLHRANALSGRQLPFLPVRTSGPVTITNVLPKALEGLLQPAVAGRPPLPQPRPQALGNQLVLRGRENWETEGPNAAASSPWR